MNKEGLIDKIVNIAQESAFNNEFNQDYAERLAEKLVTELLSSQVNEEEIEYWKTRCLLMEKIEEVNPCDPDITIKQIEAWKNYRKFMANSKLH